MRFKRRKIHFIIFFCVLISIALLILHSALKRYTYKRVSPIPIDMEEIFRENTQAFTEMAELLLENKEVFYQLNQETGLWGFGDMHALSYQEIHTRGLFSEEVWDDISAFVNSYNLVSVRYYDPLGDDDAPAIGLYFLSADEAHELYYIKENFDNPNHDHAIYETYSYLKQFRTGLECIQTPYWYYYSFTY